MVWRRHAKMKVLKTEKYDYGSITYPNILKRAKQEARKCGVPVGLRTYDENGKFCVDYVDATKKYPQIVSVEIDEIDKFLDCDSGTLKPEQWSKWSNDEQVK